MDAYFVEMQKLQEEYAGKTEYQDWNRTGT